MLIAALVILSVTAGFGLWLANYLFRKQLIPATAIYRQGDTESIKNILLCNVTIAGNVTLMMLKDV